MHLLTRIQLVDSDPGWPELFAKEAERIRAALGAVLLRIEHVGSTAVPGLVGTRNLMPVKVEFDCASQLASLARWRLVRAEQ